MTVFERLRPVLALASAMALAACSLPLLQPGPSMPLSIGLPSGRAVSGLLQSWELSGLGPDGASVQEEAPADAATITLPALVPGEWSFVLLGLGENRSVVYRAAGTATIEPGAEATLVLVTEIGFSDVALVQRLRFETNESTVGSLVTTQVPTDLRIRQDGSAGSFNSLVQADTFAPCPDGGRFGVMLSNSLAKTEGMALEFANLDLGRSFSIGFWIVPASTIPMNYTSAVMTVFSNQTCPDSTSLHPTAPGISIDVNGIDDPDNSLRVTLGDGSQGFTLATAANALDFGRWQQVVVTVDDTAQSLALFINGTEVARRSISGLDFQRSGIARIGSRLGPSTTGLFHFTGYLDDFRLYNQALSPELIAADWADRKPFQVSYDAEGGTTSPTLPVPTDMFPGNRISLTDPTFTATPPGKLFANAWLLSGGLGEAGLGSEIIMPSEDLLIKPRWNTVFSGGDGSPANPFLVETETQLRSVYRWPASSYEQREPIVLSPTPDWIPIGSPTVPFSGRYDGKSFPIQGLVINQPSTTACGLFGTVNAGTLRNIRLTTVGIKVTEHATNAEGPLGALAGEIQDGTVTNCQGSGEVITTSQSHNVGVGGLIGASSGTVITRAGFSGQVSARAYVGGLIGRLGGSAAECWSGGRVTATNGNFAGGLVGEHLGSSSIADSFSLSRVEAFSASDSYNGGLAGGSSGLGTITNCYATGPVTSNTPTQNGLAGSCVSGPTSSYFDSTRAGTSAGSGTPATPADLVKTATFAGWNIIMGIPGTHLWTIVASNNYPRLSWLQGNIQVDTSPLLLNGNFDWGPGTAQGWTATIATVYPNTNPQAFAYGVNPERGYVLHASSGDCTMSQTVDLVPIGLNGSALASASATISLSVDVFSHDHNNSGNKDNFRLQITAYDAGDVVVGTPADSGVVSMAVLDTWITQQISWTNSTAANTISKITISITGNDGENWEGNYGPIFDRIRLTITP